MTSAIRSPLRVRSARRRLAGVRRALRTGAIALAAVALVLAILTALIASARMLATPPRPPLQITLAPREAPPAPVIVGRAEQRAIIASLNLPEPRVVVPMPQPRVAPPVLALARESDPLFDPQVTGSLGLLAFAPPGHAAQRLAASPLAVVREAETALPVPRARPTRLAALSPPNALKPDEDTVPPRTAIYDITARAVYLPNGEKLEAHSGLGPMMDDPRHVHRRMRGATPPNTYILKLREKLFHGVQAIRMTPVDANGMFGRDGILAHSYLLGPSGQSHGCVSFRDYPRFLRAFLNGEIDRMVVVARLAQPPAMYARRNKMRSASSNGHNAL